MPVNGYQNYLFGGGSMAPSDFADQGPYGQQIQQNVQNGMNQSAPQMDASQQAQFRQMQMQQAQQLQGIASGQQQGAGELAVQRQVAQAQAAQQAQAAGARGGGAGMAGLQASRAQAGIGLQGAGQAQQAAMSDQQMAQGQLSGALNQGRQGDLSLANANAGFQAGQNQLQQGYANQLVQANGNALGAQASMYGANMQNKGVAGGIVNGIGAALSDERAKTDISDAGNDIDDMLSKLTAKNYRYKDEKRWGQGKRAGIMVGDLEKSDAGKALIVRNVNGTNLNGFDVTKAVSAALASAARLNERLKRLEK